jgi:hypothetical protein
MRLASFPGWGAGSDDYAVCVAGAEKSALNAEGRRGLLLELFERGPWLRLLASR